MKNSILNDFRKDISKVVSLDRAIWKIKNKRKDKAKELVDSISLEILSRIYDEESNFFLCCCYRDLKEDRPLINILVSRGNLDFQNNFIASEYAIPLSKIMKFCSEYEYFDYKDFMENLNKSCSDVSFPYFIRKDKMYVKISFIQKP